MKGNINKALFVALPLALAACGGGGGGDNPAADSNKPLAPNNNSSQSINPNTPDKYGLTSEDRKLVSNYSKEIQGSSSYNGTVIAGRVSELSNPKMTVVNKIPEVYKRQLETNSSLGTVFIPTPADITGVGEKAPGHIGGVDIYQGNSIYSSATSFRKFDYFLASSDSAYKYIQFGTAKNRDSDPVYISYSRGKTTPESAMPTSGKAWYLGEFVVPMDFVPSGKSPIGAALAEVDFANKDMSLRFGLADTYEGDIKAQIIGSAFLGQSGKKTVAGLFAGSHADEITGSYADNDQHISGVFGAKRQEQP